MTVYVLQEMGRNIRSAEKFGELKVCLPDNRQIILSSGPLAFKLQQELKDFNVQVNAVSPGLVDTRLQDEVLAAGSKAGPLLAKAVMNRTDPKYGRGACNCP